MPAGNNLSAVNVSIGSQGAQTGAKQIVASLQSIQKALTNLQRQIQSIRGGAGGGGGRGGGSAGQGAFGNLNEQIKGFNILLNRVRNFLFIIYVLRQAMDGLTSAFETFIQTGFEFNSQMEQATIGIGTLIATMGNLSREGIELKGIDSIRGGMELAKKEVLQLQIAGLQTAATTQQLVQAYQSAAGAGLRAGLSFKQLRDYTIDVVQAAQAVGVPMHQLAQETRAILEGTIDRNARVAVVLGITNKEVAKLKREGNLAAGLAQKFEAFRNVGPIIEQSFEGAISNVKEFGQTISGMVTGPLFDELKNKIVEVTRSFRSNKPSDQILSIEDLFDPKLVSAIEDFKGLFEVLGNTVTHVLDAIAGKTKEFGNQLSLDPAPIDAIAGAFERFGDLLVDIITNVDVQAWLDDIAKATNRARVDIEEGVLGWKALNAQLYSVAANIRGVIAGFQALYILLAGRGSVESRAKAMTEASKVMTEAWEDIKFAAHDASEATRTWWKFDKNKALNDLDEVRERMGTLARETRVRGFGMTSMEEGQGYYSMIPNANDPKAKQKIKDFYAAVKRFKGDYEKAAAYVDSGQSDIDFRSKKFPPPEDTKGKHAADRAAQEERSRQLAILQLYEQRRKSLLTIFEHEGDARLTELKNQLEEEKITREYYEDQRIENDKAVAEKRLQASKDTTRDVLANVRKTLGDNVTQLVDLQDPLASLERIQAIDVKAYSQVKAEALRELEQNLSDVITKMYDLDKANKQISPLLNKFRPFEKVEVIQPYDEMTATEKVLYDTREKALKKDLQLQQAFNDAALKEVEIGNLALRGKITEAEAEERMLDLAERQRDLDVAALEREKIGLQIAGDRVGVLRIEGEIAAKLAQIFKISNFEAFWKGMRAEADTLTKKFEQLGRDIRSIFRDSFEAAGREGIKGFATTFLQGIANLLNTRAADALSKIVVDILGGIFTGGGKQSPFDKLLEQILSIFGRAPNGKFSIGGILEKVFGTLLDPLGKKKGVDPTGAGLPTLQTGIGDALKRAQEQAAATKEAREAQMPTDIKHISTQVDEIVRLLQASKDCCDRNNQALQAMAGAKGPGLLGSLLSSVAGAAVGIGVGGLFSSTGVKFKQEGYDYAPDTSTSGWFNARSAQDMSAAGNLFGNVAVNVYAQDVKSFGAPQTQAQIASAMSIALNKSNGLVGGTSTTPNK